MRLNRSRVIPGRGCVGGVVGRVGVVAAAAAGSEKSVGVAEGHAKGPAETVIPR